MVSMGLLFSSQQTSLHFHFIDLFSSQFFLQIDIENNLITKMILGILTFLLLLRTVDDKFDYDLIIIEKMISIFKY